MINKDWEPADEPWGASPSQPMRSAPVQQTLTPRSIGGLSTALTILLWTSCGLAVLAVVDSIASLQWLSGKPPNGADFWFDQPAMWAMLSGLLAFLALAVWLATVVVWCVWQNFATKNVLAWGGIPRRGSGWAVGAWFVPIINLWWPAQNVHDVTRLSSREIPPGTLAERAPSEPLIGWWWGVWLLSGVAGQISSRLFFDAQTNSEWTAAYTSDVISQPIGAVSAVLAIRVVSLVAARQQERLRSPDPGPSEMGLNL